jgi:hypothetical protein
MSTWTFSVYPFPTTSGWKKLNIDESVTLMMANGERTKYALVKKDDFIELTQGVFILEKPTKTASYDTRPSRQYYGLQLVT